MNNINFYRAATHQLYKIGKSQSNGKFPTKCQPMHRTSCFEGCIHSQYSYCQSLTLMDPSHSTKNHVIVIVNDQVQTRCKL